jgi:hypothetical protein
MMHLSAEHESRLAELVGKATRMPARQVNAPVRVEPDHIYIGAPGQHLEMRDGHLTASAESRCGRGGPMAVDRLMVSLAADQRERAIGVVLTGADPTARSGVKGHQERRGLHDRAGQPEATAMQRRDAHQRHRHRRGRRQLPARRSGRHPSTTSGNSGLAPRRTNPRPVGARVAARHHRGLARAVRASTSAASRRRCVAPHPPAHGAWHASRTMAELRRRRRRRTGPPRPGR